MDGLDAAPRGPWLPRRPPRPVGRRDRRRSALEPGRPPGQLPPDRCRRRGRGAGAVRPRGWPHDRRADPAVARPGRRAGSSRSPSAPACTWCSGPASTSSPVHEPWVATLERRRSPTACSARRGDGIGDDRHPAGHLRRDRHVRPGPAGGAPGPAGRGAAASAASGLAISVHLHPWGHEGRAVLDVLTGAGADRTA